MKKSEAVERLIALTEQAIEAGLGATASYLAQGLISLVDDLPAEGEKETAPTKKVGYDWWVVERDGIPELEQGQRYTYEYLNNYGDTRAYHAGLDECTFHACDETLRDADNWVVVRICKTWQGA